MELLKNLMGVVMVVGLGLGLVEGGSLKNSGKIIGGSPAHQGQFPHQVTIMKRALSGTKGHLCGGSIISPTFVLTAAACVKGQTLNPLFVRAGEINFTVASEFEQEVKPLRLIPHPLYDATRNLNDIALVELATPFVLDVANVDSAKLPASNSDVGPGEECVVSGFGNEKEGDASSRVLRYVYLPSVSDADCLVSYPNQIDPSMLCAGFGGGGAGSCQGDSGSPVSCGDVQDTLHGIVSWGAGCARPEYPEVNTQVSYFVDWIKEEMGASFSETKTKLTMSQ